MTKGENPQKPNTNIGRDNRSIYNKGTYWEKNYYYNLYISLQDFLNNFFGLNREEDAKIRNKLLKAVDVEITQRLKYSLQQDSLQIDQYLELPMEEDLEAVGIQQRPKIYKLPPETQIIDVFEREDIARRLLILGEPGSGKTTVLLQLARDLATQAIDNQNKPIPVIFELSAWKNDKLSIEEWLIAQLKDIYSINDERISKRLLKNNQILPLLDGLDELGLTRQRLCIEQINQYLQQDTQRDLVVCCRREEYEEGKVLITYLNGAYCLQPPSEEEIQNYLQRLGKVDLWNVIQTNPQMRELADIPLLLNIMVTTYKGQPITDKHKLFDAYIEEKIKPPKRQPPKLVYTSQQTKRWLTFLARQLEAESRTEFLIENMQPIWLQSSDQLWAYKLILGLFLGLIYGLIFVLFFGLMFGLFYELIFLWLTSGINLGGILGLFLGGRNCEIELIEAFDLSMSKLIFGLRNGLFLCLNYGLIYGLISGLIFGLFIGLSYGLILGLISQLISWLMIGLIFGLKTDIKAKEIPNQGIKESFKKILFISLITTPVCLLIPYLVTLATGLTFFVNPLIFSLNIGLITGFSAGGLACIQHFSLRLILWQNGDIPWNYARFLKYAAERRLIQQVGGRYRFIHDNLRKKFVGNQLNTRSSISLFKNSWLKFPLFAIALTFTFIFVTSIYQLTPAENHVITPNLQANNWVFTDKITHRWRNLQRGNLIRFWIYDYREKRDFKLKLYYIILPIVGLPEERLEIKEGKVYINGAVLEADYLTDLPLQNYQGELEIPADNYFVLCKNPDDENKLLYDLVHKKQITSQILFRLF